MKVGACCHSNQAPVINVDGCNTVKDHDSLEIHNKLLHIFCGKKKGQNFVYQLYFIILYQGALLSCLEYFIFYFKYCFVSFAMYFLFPGFDFFERGILNIQIFKL